MDKSRCCISTTLRFGVADDQIMRRISGGSFGKKWKDLEIASRLGTGLGLPEVIEDALAPAACELRVLRAAVRSMGFLPLRDILEVHLRNSSKDLRSLT